MRFHPHKKWFAHNLTVSPLLSQDEAMLLVRAHNYDQLVEGHIRIAVDVVGRFLHWANLPHYLGEEALAEAVTKLVTAVRCLNRSHNNISAYLSTAVENRLLELTDCLVYLPRGRRPAPFNIFSGEKHKWDRWLAGREYKVGRMWEIIRNCCLDAIDRRLVRLRYAKGAGPRSMIECAGLIGISPYEANMRLDALEDRVYKVLEKDKPKNKRQSRRIFEG